MSRKTRRPTPRFVMARSRTGRPVLMHGLTDGTMSETFCNQSMSGWSRVYIDRATAQTMRILYCRRCLRIGGEL